MGKRFSHLTWDKRVAIASYLKAEMPKIKIAELVGIHVSTVYREIDKGSYIHLNSDLTTEVRYSPDIAEKNYKFNLKEKGDDLKIGNDREYANFLERKIVEEKYSPEAVLLEIEEKGLQFSTKICVKTFYNYIDNGVFFELTNKSLPIKRNKKRGYRKVKKRTKILGKSIEERDKQVEDREEFGHWEMDCVEGKKTNKKVLLVLTERKTRQEIVVLMKKQNVKCVVKALDTIEKKLGFKKFCKIFKTITVDNGKEFAGSEEFERSIISKKKKRTTVFYCHPYASCERGSNENANKLIRRHLPKGTDFKNLTDEDVKFIENWINNYPRGIFNGKSSMVLFKNELEKLDISYEKT